MEKRLKLSKCPQNHHSSSSIKYSGESRVRIVVEHTGGRVSVDIGVSVPSFEYVTLTARSHDTRSLQTRTLHLNSYCSPHPSPSSVVNHRVIVSLLLHCGRINSSRVVRRILHKQNQTNKHSPQSQFIAALRCRPTWRIILAGRCCNSIVARVFVNTRRSISSTPNKKRQTNNRKFKQT
jgi:hypothetical protein